jgi:hypothetical protein
LIFEIWFLKDAFKEMIVLLEEIKGNEISDNDVYFEFSSNVDLFYLNYKNILRYFTKLISIKFYRVSSSLEILF